MSEDYETIMTLQAPRDPDQVAAWLAVMDDDTFTRYVAADAHSRLDAEAAAGLRHPRNRKRWHAAIKGLQADVQVQFAAKAGDQSREARAWRVKARRWEERLIAARREASRWIAQPDFAEGRPRSSHLSVAKQARGERWLAAAEQLIEAHLDEFRALLAEQRDGLPPTPPEREAMLKRLAGDLWPGRMDQPRDGGHA